MSLDDQIHTVAREVVALATQTQQTFAFAESLTGGLCAAEIVAVPGASQVLLGGVVAYATAMKHELLGVNADLLASRGPVDSEVAAQMASGVRERCVVSATALGDASVDQGVNTVSRSSEKPCIGVATTGVAGPSPDEQSGQLPGQVWIGVSSSRHTFSREFTFAGSRAEIRKQTVLTALTLLREQLDDTAE